MSEKLIMSEKMQVFSVAYNMLRLCSEIDYVTKENFVKTQMNYCLEHNIITEEASKDSIWKEENINIIDGIKIELINPHKPLAYTKFDEVGNEIKPEKQYWNFKLYQVVLPRGWYLARDYLTRDHKPALSIDSIDPTDNSFCIYDECDGIVKKMEFM